MRLPALLTLIVLALLAPGVAGAVTLEQYFFGFSDRDRGVYITGVLDLFAADSSRDPEYRHCVSELGPAGMHQAISKIVKEDPRLLSFDASLWILYEASRHCNTSADGASVPDPRSMLPAVSDPASKAPGVPDLTAAPVEVTEQASPPSGTFRLFWKDWRYLAAGSIILLLVAALATVLVRRSRGRRRSGASRGGPAAVRRPSPLSKHG